MKNTVANILKDTRYDRTCTFIVNCMGETEVYIREHKDMLIRHWGLEEATVYFLNTREVMINII